MTLRVCKSGQEDMRVSRAGTRACEAATPFSNDLNKFSPHILNLTIVFTLSSPAPSVQGETELAEVGTNDSEESRHLVPFMADHNQLLKMLQLGKALPHPGFFRPQQPREVFQKQEKADGM